jgi:hypothetical protein
MCCGDMSFGSLTLGLFELQGMHFVRLILLDDLSIIIGFELWARIQLKYKIFKCKPYKSHFVFYSVLNFYPN